MGRWMGLVGVAWVGVFALAQGNPTWKPILNPGEGLALGSFRDGLKSFGEGDTPHDLGLLARILWTRLQGTEWEARGYSFRCTGVLEGQTCSNPRGHGRVDLGKALREGCDLAFLAWIRATVDGWTRESGEGSSRARLEEAFRPFLGARMMKGEGPPPLDRAWVGRDGLLQASPRGFLTWAIEPNQEGLAQQGRRYFGSLIQDPIGEWWFAAEPERGVEAPGTWVYGSDGANHALLWIPAPLDRPRAVARFKAVLGLR